MPVNITDITTLDTDTVDEKADFLVEFIQDLYPTLDLSRGSVLYGLLIRPQAVLHTLNQTNMDRLRQSMSLSAINADATLADDDIVTALLSNYNITRTTGTVASGSTTAIFNKLAAVTIPSSVTFTTNGIVFRPIRSFNGVTSAANVVTAGDRVLQNLGNSQYGLTVDLVAVDAGIAGNVPFGTVFTVDTSLASFISALAANTFTGGADTETNAQLVQRMQDGVSVPNFGSRLTAKTAITNVFPSVTDVSVIGAGDNEMLRDTHNTLGFGGGGKVDVYVRNSPTTAIKTLTKSATLISTSPGFGIWRFNFARDDVPGFYEVVRVYRTGAANLEITSDVRSENTGLVTGLDTTPTMTGSESVYTRYQTADIDFKDTTAENIAVSTTENFQVEVRYMPQLDSINDYVLSRDQRHAGGDYLVKAAVPCLVSLALSITKGPGDATPDTAAIKLAIANAVNSLDFVHGRLTTTLITSVVQGLLTGRSRVDFPPDLRGRIMMPTGISTWLFARNENNFELIVPNRPADMTTSRTVAFFLDAANITLTVNESDHVLV